VGLGIDAGATARPQFHHGGPYEQRKASLYEEAADEAEEGADANLPSDPLALAAFASSVFYSVAPELGLCKTGAGSHLDESSQRRMARRLVLGSRLAVRAAQRCDPTDPIRICILSAGAAFLAALHPATHAFAAELDLDGAVGLEVTKEFVELYDYAQHHQLCTERLSMADANLVAMPSCYLLACYGDLSTSRLWLSKLAAIFESRPASSTPTLFAAAQLGSCVATNTLHRLARFTDEGIRILEATGMTFYAAGACPLAA